MFLVVLILSGVLSHTYAAPATMQSRFAPYLGIFVHIEPCPQPTFSEGFMTLVRRFNAYLRNPDRRLIYGMIAGMVVLVSVLPRSQGSRYVNNNASLSAPPPSIPNVTHTSSSLPKNTPLMPPSQASPSSTAPSMRPAEASRSSSSNSPELRSSQGLLPQPIQSPGISVLSTQQGNTPPDSLTLPPAVNIQGGGAVDIDVQNPRRNSLDSIATEGGLSAPSSASNTPTPGDTPPLQSVRTSRTQSLVSNQSLDSNASLFSLDDSQVDISQVNNDAPVNSDQ